MRQREREMARIRTHRIQQSLYLAWYAPNGSVTLQEGPSRLQQDTAIVGEREKSKGERETARDSDAQA